MRWLDSGFADVLALERFTPEGEDPSILVVVNTSECSVTLPTEWGIDLLVTSGPEVAVVNEGGHEQVALGAATAVWLRGPAVN
jgi:hypothetical protein